MCIIVVYQFNISQQTQYHKIDVLLGNYYAQYE